MKPRRQPPHVRLDEEILALHEGEPELLALADAVQATQRAHDWRRRGRLPLAAALAAALVVAAVVAVVASDNSSAGIVDDARRALEAEPVLHAVVASQLPGDFIVDLERGTTAPSRAEHLVWFDTASGRIRVAARRNGEVVSVSDEASTIAAVFLSAYEEALAAGRVEDVSEERRSFVIRGDDVSGRVELGADNLPASFTPAGARPIRFARFSAIAAIPLLAVPRKSPAIGGVIVAKEATTLAAASVRARFKPLAPAVLAGLPRRQILIERLATEHAQGTLVGSGIAVLYSDAGRFLAVRQSRSPAPAYAFDEGRTAGGNPIPESPRIDVRRESGEVLAQFRLGGLYVSIRGSSESLIVTAARELSG